MATRALATFDNLSHDTSPLGLDAGGCARAQIVRRYEGDLIGESRAELLISQPADGLFGYVGLDVFTGSLAGRTGSFVFQHGGMYEAGAMRPFGFVVTGSGAGELTGLRGDIVIAALPNGRHAVTLDYAFD